MVDITVLHLSDLHIEAKTSYSRVLSSLLDDIKKQTEKCESHSIIVVVTGDIFNKGPAYEDKEYPHQAYNSAISFFTKLKGILEDKVLRIYLVPGNHDKFRSTLDEYLSTACRESMSKSLDRRFYEKVWPSFLDNYKKNSGTGYLELFQEVYKMFHSEPDTLNIDTCSFLNKTYGVDTFSLKGKEYCVVMLNTAWTCLESDDRNLFIGDFQFNQIKEEFAKKYSSAPPDLAIVLGHHPTSCLHGKEEDTVLEQLLSYDKLDANLYICGHRHDQFATNLCNNRHSLNTFVSGIGWPKEDKKEYVGVRTYAFYDIDSEANAIEVHMRATANDGVFKPNFSVYTGDTIDENHHPKTIMSVPLRAEKAQHYIELSRAGLEDAKAYYLSSDLIKYIQNYQNIIAKISFEVSEVFRDVCTDVLLHVNEAEFNSVGKSKTKQDEYNEWWGYFFEDDEDVRKNKYPVVKSLFIKYKNVIFSHFHSYLFQICTIMGAQFSPVQSEDKIRFHFRYLSTQTQTYKNLCVSLNDDYKVSDIKYGQLIKAAYESKKSLIYSVNKIYAEGGISKRWKDFITVIPTFAGNTIAVRGAGKKTSAQELPAITFGVTIGSEEYENLLYSLDFFHVGDIINILIDYFLTYFDIDLKGFCEWYDKNICKEEK